MLSYFVFPLPSQVSLPLPDSHSWNTGERESLPVLPPSGHLSTGLWARQGRCEARLPTVPLLALLTRNPCSQVSVLSTPQGWLFPESLRPWALPNAILTAPSTQHPNLQRRGPRMGKPSLRPPVLRASSYSRSQLSCCSVPSLTIFCLSSLFWAFKCSLFFLHYFLGDLIPTQAFKRYLCTENTQVSVFSPALCSEHLARPSHWRPGICTQTPSSLLNWHGYNWTLFLPEICSSWVLLSTGNSTSIPPVAQA